MTDGPTSGLFIEDGSELRALPEASVKLEDELQTLVAAHPELLSGDDDQAAGRRWLLIRREQGIAAGDGEADRFSLDHLFVDQEGIPTLVEVKRASDTRARREVVAQMLDYAANAQNFMDAAAVRGAYEAENPDAAELVEAALGADIEPDVLWDKFASNLRAGNLRLVFLADRIPSELRTLIEFLNEQFTSIQVYGIEVTTFQAEDQKVIRTRTIGQTQAAQAAKQRTPSSRRTWDRESWLEALEQRTAPEVVAAAERIFAFAEERNLVEIYGNGAVTASVQLGLKDETAYCFPFLIYNDGGIEVGFQWMMGMPYKPFDEREKREALRERLLAIRGLEIPIEKIDKRPSFRMELLTDESAYATFEATFEWALAQAREAGR